MLAGTVLAHPLRGQDAAGGYDFDVPLLAGDHVTTEAGTGFVHIAPGHGADDFVLGQKNGLPVRSEEHTSELQSLMLISYAVFCLKQKILLHTNQHLSS